MCVCVRVYSVSVCVCVCVCVDRDMAWTWDSEVERKRIQYHYEDEYSAHVLREGELEEATKRKLNPSTVAKVCPALHAGCVS